MKNLHVVSHLQHSRVSLIVLVVFLLGGPVRVALAEVRLPAIISEHMVLQAECPVRVWGWASPAEHVTVSIAGQTQSTTANASGKWQVTLSPLAKTNTATTMTVKRRNTLTVKNVRVGEVWFGSGQSK